MTTDDVLDLLRTRAAQAGSVLSYSRLLGIPQQMISAALNGTRPISKALLGKIGLRRVMRYEKIPARTTRRRRPRQQP